MTPSLPGSGRGPRVLVAVLLVIGAAFALVAALAGSPGGLGDFSGFGPGFVDVAPPPVAAAARPAPVVAPSRALGDTAAGDTAPAGAVGRSYAVPPPFRPARLLLPGGRSARVAAVGLRRDGSLVVPEDPRVVGWWTGGAMPGEPFGSVVVAGHVDSASRGVGVLAALPTLRAGQVVELRTAARGLRYRVVSAHLVPQARLSRTGGIFRADGPAQLVLITCGGSFDPVRHRYADNYVVVARPVSDE